MALYANQHFHNNDVYHKNSTYRKGRNEVIEMKQDNMKYHRRH